MPQRELRGLGPQLNERPVSRSLFRWIIYDLKFNFYLFLVLVFLFSTAQGAPSSNSPIQYQSREVGPYSPTYVPVGPNPYVRSRLDDYDYYDPEKTAKQSDHVFASDADAGNAYRRAPPQVVSPPRPSDAELLKLKLDDQEYHPDLYHFDQRYEVGDDKLPPRVGMVLSDGRCMISPPPKFSPDASFYTITCPNEVKKLQINFLDDLGVHFQIVQTEKGKPLKELTFSIRDTNKIQSKNIQACKPPGKSDIGDNCRTVKLDVRRSAAASPSLSSITVNHSPTPMQPFKGNNLVYSVDLPENEPVHAVSRASKSFFVDSRSMRPESRFTEGSTIHEFRPRGKVFHYPVFVTNQDRSMFVNYTISASTYPSTNPNLYKFESSAGRLDPPFSPSHYAYFLRVLPGTKTVKLNLEAMDDLNTVCVYTNIEGKIVPIRGRGKTTALPAGPFSHPLIMECRNSKDTDNHVRYILQPVQQAGGSTLLKFLDVLGGTMQPAFNPLFKGPYEVNLRNSDAGDVSWASFQVLTSNPAAMATVEGYLVDGLGRSPFFKIPDGERMRFAVSIRTLENPVAENYVVYVDRGSGGSPGSVTSLWAGRVLGGLSSLVSSSRAYHFIHNAKFLQFISFSSRLNGLPDTFQSFASAFNPWNFQTGSQYAVSLVGSEGTYWGRTDYSNFGGNGTFVASPSVYGLKESHLKTGPDLIYHQSGVPQVKYDSNVLAQAAAKAAKNADKQQRGLGGSHLAGLPTMLTKSFGTWSPAFLTKDMLEKVTARLAESNPNLSPYLNGDVLENLGASLQAPAAADNENFYSNSLQSDINPDFYETSKGALREFKASWLAAHGSRPLDTFPTASLADWFKKTPSDVSEQTPPKETPAEQKQAKGSSKRKMNGKVDSWLRALQRDRNAADASVQPNGLAFLTASLIPGTSDELLSLKDQSDYIRQLAASWQMQWWNGKSVEADGQANKTSSSETGADALKKSSAVLVNDQIIKAACWFWSGTGETEIVSTDNTTVCKVDKSKSVSCSSAQPTNNSDFMKKLKSWFWSPDENTTDGPVETSLPSKRSIMSLNRMAIATSTTTVTPQEMRKSIWSWAGDTTASDDSQAAAIETLTGSLLDAPRRQLSPLSLQEKNTIMSSLDSSFRENQKLVDYAFAVSFMTIAAMAIGFVYVLTWFFWLRKSIEEITVIRRDYWMWLKPSRFWTFVGDIAFLSYCQSCAGLIFTEFSAVEISVFGFHVTPHSLSWICIVMIIAYPCLFVLAAVVKLAALQSSMTYSKSLNRYHDKWTQQAKAFDSVAPWLPVVDRMTTMEIQDVIPIRKDAASSGIVFKPDTHHSGPWIEADPRLVGRSDRGSNSYSAMASKLEDQEYSEEHMSMLQGQTSRSLDKADSVVKYYKEFDTAKCDFELANYVQSSYENKNYREYEKYPNAKVGMSRFEITNPYDQEISMLCSMQIKHLSPLANSPMENMPLIVPREGFSMEGVDDVHNLFGKSQKGNLYYWVVDRVMILSLALFMGAYTDFMGWKSTMVMGIVCGAMAVSCIPGAWWSGLSRWYENMVQESDNQIKRMIYNDFIVNVRYKVWPFMNLRARVNYEEDEVRKEITRRQSATYAWYVWAYQFYEDFVDNDFWKTRLWHTTLCVLRGPVASEFWKCLALMTLMVANRDLHILGPSFASYSAMVMLTTGLICLNLDSIHDFYRDCKYPLKEIVYGMRRVAVWTFDSSSLKPYWSDFISFYMQQLEKVISGQKHISFIFPGFQAGTVRDCKCREGTIICNTLGVQMEGRLVKTAISKEMQLLEAVPLSKPRYYLYKTLYKSTGIGVYRSQLDRGLPIALPLGQFCCKEKFPSSRLAATIQIVNHNGLRYVPWGHRFDYEDDSYLSLFTDRRFVPEGGKLRRKFKGHGYSFRVDKLKDQVVIVGPGIIQGHSYRLKTRPNEPEKNPDYSYSASSEASSEHHGGECETETFCTTSGELRVNVPPGKSPDLGAEIKVIFMGTPNDPFYIHPLESHVEYDRVHGHLYLQTRKAIVSEHPYLVRWLARSPGEIMKGDSIASCDGVLSFNLEPGFDLDLRSRIRLQDMGIDGSNKREQQILIHIDPRDTDAHQFYLPSSTSPNPVADHVAAAKAWFINEWNSIKGINHLEKALAQPVPCTVVQCVDPLRRLYRVDPNFEEPLRSVQAQIEVLEAVRADLGDWEKLPDIWHNFMTTAEFVKLWDSMGLAITDATGRFVDPTRNPRDPLISGYGKLVSEGEVRIRMHIEQKVMDQQRKLGRIQDELLRWDGAYKDMALREAQHRRDTSNWSVMEQVEIGEQVEELRKLKMPYEAVLPNFQYPMILEEKMIQRRANWVGQLAEWEEEIRSWLLDEEAPSLQPLHGGVPCGEFTVREIMNGLRKTIRKQESLMDGEYRSVLHYVTPSRSIRGLDVNWRPDPLSAHPAAVRVWKSDGTRRTYGEFVWMPCYMKLTGNAIQIMAPQDNDFDTTQFETRHPWRCLSAGWYIPLRCLEAVECVYDPLPPPNAQTYSPVLGMHGKIICRRHMGMPIREDAIMELSSRSQRDEFGYQDPVTKQVCSQFFRLGWTMTRREAELLPEEEKHGRGERVNAYPLMFKTNMYNWKKWVSVIQACEMDKPPRRMDISSVPDELIIKLVEAEAVEKKLPSPRPQLLPDVTSGDISSLSDDATSSGGGIRMDANMSHSVDSTAWGGDVLPSESDTGMPPPPVFAEELQTEQDFLSPGRSVFGTSADELSESPVVAVAQIIPSGIYTGIFKDWRYDGFGVLRDPRTSSVVYSGNWRRGVRETGYGEEAECNFVDSEGVAWKYKGGFLDDEFCDMGLLMMTDDIERQRLKDARDDPTFKNKVTEFAGLFKKPKAIQRSDSFPPRGVDPTKLMRDIQSLFENDKRDLYNLGSHERDLLKPTVVLDPRRAVSATGDEALESVLLAELGADFYKTRAKNKLIANAAKSGRMPSLSDDSVASFQDASLAVDEYMPFRAKWARMVDSNLGYQSMNQRFADGVSKFADGHIYRGTMVGGRPDGNGNRQKGTYPHFACEKCELEYYGQFLKGLPNGMGVISVGSGEDKITYWGEFREGQRHGRGIQTAFEGKLFMEGGFVNDVISGADCFIKVHDGIRNKVPYRSYHGEMVDGLFSGKGKLVFKDGQIYEGEFLNGQRHGFGSIKDQYGREILSGVWEKDYPQGRAPRLMLQYNQVYSGDLYKGVCEGVGELFDKVTGKVVYEGVWRDGVPHGRGVLNARDGTYEGEFKYGKRAGKGKMVFTDSVLNGDPMRYYEGNWEDDTPHGTGSYFYDADVGPIALQFKKGVPTESSLKAYKDGMCGSAPKIELFPTCEDIKVHSFHPTYWGQLLYLNPDHYRTGHAIGSGLWKIYDDMKYDFVAPEDITPLGIPPSMTPPIRPTLSALPDCPFPSEPSFHLKSISDGALDSNTRVMETGAAEVIGNPLEELKADISVSNF